MPHLIVKGLRAIIYHKVGRVTLGVLSGWQCCITRSVEVVYSHG